MNRPITPSFVAHLRELGWIENRNVAIEYRWSEGRTERYAEIAAEFVRLKVDVIVTVGSAVPSVRQAASVIPIVFAVAATWYAKNTAKLAEDFKACGRRIAEHLAPGARVLEVAPGPGYLAVELAKLGPYRITGLDISRSFVRMATDYAARPGVDVEFRQGDAAALPFADDTFDFIVCRAAFKNFSNPVAALSEMHRVLRSGGEALVIDMRNDASNEAIDATVDHMRLGRVDAFLTRAVFKHMLRRRFQGRFRAHGGRIIVWSRRHQGDSDGVRRLAAQIVRAELCRCCGLRRSGHRRGPRLRADIDLRHWRGLAP
jgi:ubiquinone/menaquinone biosynthesis C-methylase UbiE